MSQPLDDLHRSISDLLTLLRSEEGRQQAGLAKADLEALEEEINALRRDRDAEAGGLLARIEKAIEALEIAHPDATAILGRVSQSLAELGI